MIVPGDADACGALGVALQRAARGVDESRRGLASARSATACWAGSAGTSWRTVEQRQQAAAQDLAAALHAAGAALVTFAAALVEAKALAAAAVRHAAYAGLSVTADGAIARVHVPYGPFTTPEQEESAREAGRRAQVREEALRKVALAEAAEQAAHDALARALRGIDAASCPAAAAPGTGTATGRSLPEPGWNDWVDLANGLVLARGQAHHRAAGLADGLGKLAKDIKAATKLGGPAERAAARKEWKAALAQMRAAQRAADAHALRVSRLQPASGWLGRFSQPLTRSVPVVRHVPGVSVVMTGAGVWVDVGHKDMDPTLAVVKNTASTAAGMAAGAATTAGVAVLMTGGAVALAPVAAGVLVGAGVGVVVGWGVEEYGDDVVDAVKDVGTDAADLAGRLWGKITG